MNGEAGSFKINKSKCHLSMRLRKVTCVHLVKENSTGTRKLACDQGGCFPKLLCLTVKREVLLPENGSGDRTRGAPASDGPRAPFAGTVAGDGGRAGH